MSPLFRHALTVALLVAVLVLLPDPLFQLLAARICRYLVLRISHAWLSNRRRGK